MSKVTRLNNMVGVNEEGDICKNEDDLLDDVDSAAVDAIEEVRDSLTKGAIQLRLEMTRPSVLFRPVLSKTATAWKAVYGEFQVFGTTPAMTMSNFDAQWVRRTVTNA